MSRELDIKVAEALSFDVWKSDFDGGLLFAEAGVITEYDGRRVSRGPLPHYSTGYAALEEMFGFLRRHGAIVLDFTEGDNEWCEASLVLRMEWRHSAEGTSIPEAVARLVVAVAEAQR